MPCITGIIENNQLIINVGISTVPADEVRSGSGAIVNALIDTGAQFTCISSNIAKKLKLRPIGKTRMQSASETVEVNVYKFYVSVVMGCIKRRTTKYVRSSIYKIRANIYRYGNPTLS